MSTVKTEAAIEDLYAVEGKAEIVNGEIAYMSPTGVAPNYAAGEIFASLREYAKRTGRGRAVTDNAGFEVNLPGRMSLSPDAAYYVGHAEGGDFFKNAPAFGVEVRSKNDYGTRAERKINDKRHDYFAAGTLVVWDVDVLREQVVRVYRHDAPDNPQIFRRGDVADAEPAVPGWQMNVDELFV